MVKKWCLLSGVMVAFICFLASPVFAEPALYEIYNAIYGTSLTSNAELESTYGVADEEVFGETDGYVKASARYAGYTQQFGYYTGLCTGTGQVELFNVTQSGYLYRCSGSGNSCIEDDDCPPGQTCDPLYDAIFLVGGGTTTIGFYIDPSGSPAWFTQPSLNSDGKDHMKTFRAADFNPDNPEYLIAWEDLPNLGDADFQDLVLTIRYLEPEQVKCCEDDDDCDDSDNCTIDSCVEHVCVYSPKDCSYLEDQCNVGVCDPITGECVKDPTPKNGLSCDDGDSCTVNDTCSNGVCRGTAKDCSYLEDECNVGVCDPVTGNCVKDPTPKNGLSCDDDTFCNGVDSCVNGVCTHSGDPCLPLYCDEDNDRCYADVAIIAEPVWASPGDVGIKVDLCLDNRNFEVGGVQVDLCETIKGVPVNCLTCVGCELTERTVLFDCVVLEQANGCCRVILFSKHPGGVINPGLCSVVKIDYTFCDPDDPSCPEECNAMDCITITPVNPKVADPYGYPLVAATVAGELCPFECGDVYPPESASGAKDCGDGDVNIFDILTEVNFALNPSHVPDACQRLRADVPTGTPPYCLDPDGEIDIFDVMVLIDMALNRQDCCSYYYMGKIY